MAIATAATALSCLSAACGHDRSPGPVSAKACITSVAALRQFADGDRSLDSTEGALRAAEGDARWASGQDRRYEPITAAVVAVQDEIRGGDGQGPGARLLFGECG